MQRRIIFALLSSALGMACSSHPFQEGDDSGPDGQAGFEGGFADVYVGLDGGGDDGGCKNLQCNVDLSCDAGQTTLTGTVYDPAGALGLNGIFVYIPNATPDPITPGSPTCTPCQAPASGSPIISALTDANGKFTLQHGPQDKWGVPSGDNIPIVIQAGKWRRQLVIPHVDDCGTVDLDALFNSGTGTLQQKHQLRLPSKSSEGDMPLIAFTSGYDPAECFLLHMGIDQSEFVAPNNPGGHVQFFTGNSSGTSDGAGSQIAGGNTPLQTYQWWSDHNNLLKYDIVFNSCEGAPNSRIPKNGAVESPYVAMDEYLKGGGRLFATHFYENWFTTNATPDLQSAASWHPWGTAGGEGISETESVDQSFPKGQAFAQWLVNAGASTTLGEISLTDTRDDVLAQTPTGCSTKNGTCYSTQWLVHPGDNHPRYVSFNAPVDIPNPMQCGRAVLSDVHLSGTTNGQMFPNECAQTDPSYAANEKALEFLFFDLASCVQDDSKPQQQPN